MTKAFSLKWVTLSLSGELKLRLNIAYLKSIWLVFRRVFGLNHNQVLEFFPLIYFLLSHQKKLSVYVVSKSLVPPRPVHWMKNSYLMRNSCFIQDAMKLVCCLFEAVFIFPSLAGYSNMGGQDRNYETTNLCWCDTSKAIIIQILLIKHSWGANLMGQWS